MSVSNEFTDYNRRYLELREIFEFLFPVKQNYNGKQKEKKVQIAAGTRTLSDFHKLLADEIADILGNKESSNSQKLKDAGFILAKNKMLGNRANSRISIDHNSYQIENELWYNIIFTLYRQNNNSIEDNDIETLMMAPKNIGFGIIKNYASKLGGDKNLYSFLGTMDKFAPYSTIGFWLYLRMRSCLQDGAGLPKPFPIVFHGGNPRLGGLQDILYQISCLIQEQKEKVYINDVGPFQLKGIVYEDVSLMQENNNPYIIAECNYKGRQKAKIYVKGDMDIQVYDKSENGNYYKARNVLSLETAEVEHERIINKQKEVEHKRIINKQKVIEGPIIFIHTYDKKIDYDLYLITNKNIKGDYLLNKVLSEGKWYDAEAVRDDKIKCITTNQKLSYSFKYYAYEEEKWDILLFHFCINEKDTESFGRWVDSFGNFAYCRKIEIPCNNDTKPEETQPEYIYVEFIDNIKARVRRKPNKKLLNKHPRKTLLNNQTNYKELTKDSVSFLELNWMMYTLCKYPNFSSVFLHAPIWQDDHANKGLTAENDPRTARNIYNFIAQIQNFMAENSGAKETNPFFKTYALDSTISRLELRNTFGAKEIRNKIKCILDEYGVKIDTNAVKDLSENHMNKMYHAVTGIREKHYYRCQNNEKAYNAVLPYAIDFDVIAYNESGKGILIMAYDLVQKRVVAIPFSKFQFEKSQDGNSKYETGEIEYHYGAFDKLYYFCSCMVKMYLQDSAMTNNILLELLGKKFPNLFQEREVNDIPLIEEISELYENSIKQWDEYGKESGKLVRENDLNCNGVTLFTQKEVEYKRLTWKAMLFFYNNNFLDQICGENGFLTDDVCKELIIGNAPDVIRDMIGNRMDNFDKQSKERLQDLEKGLLNEVQYINSVLKIHELVFQLRDGYFDLDHVVVIYDYFRNFNCAGRYDGKNYVFKVQYEGFQYRKIHEIILSLNKWITVLNDASPFNNVDGIIEETDKIKGKQKEQAKQRKHPKYHVKQNKEDWQQEEQAKQSELLTNRAGEEKEKLKEAIQKYLKNMDKEEGKTFAE